MLILFFFIFRKAINSFFYYNDNNINKIKVLIIKIHQTPEIPNLTNFV